MKRFGTGVVHPRPRNRLFGVFLTGAFLWSMAGPAGSLRAQDADDADATDADEVAVEITLPPGIDPTGVLLPPPDATFPTGVSTNAAGKPVEPSPEEKRLQELLKLQFDRRPQSVIQAIAKKTGSHVLTNAVQQFQLDIVAGDWQAAGEFLKQLSPEHAAKVYKHLLQALQRGPQGGPPGMAPPHEIGDGHVHVQMPGPPGQQAGPVLLPEDVLALAEIAPGELTDENAEALGKLLSRALSKGHFIEPLIARLQTGLSQIGGEDPKKRELAVKLLVSANRLRDAGHFLPPLEPAIKNKEVKALDLHARFLTAQGKEASESAKLLQAWDLTQMILSETGTNTVKEREQGLTRALELMPLISKQVGTNWLRESFAKRPEQGMAILASLSSAVTQPAQGRDAESRRKNLELQRRIIDELLSIAGAQVQPWQPALNILALAWVQEADLTKTRYINQRNMRRQTFDPYGNPIYYGDYPQPPQNPNELPPIAPEQLLPTAPSQSWLAALEKSLTPKVQMAMAELHFKAEEETKAVPYIAAVAAVQPKTALKLANDLLQSWARSRDPNQQQNMYGPRYYYGPYGYMQQMGTPLTRAMQVRNITELSNLLKELRALPIGDLDEKVVVGAFTAAHSQAEVFRVEDIEAVFGTMGSMRAEILSELLQTMRQRLAGQWRMPQIQQMAKTKRTDKEIETEVMRGYELVSQLIQAALDRSPNEWRLHLVQAAATYDWAEFDYGKKVDLAIYTEKRDRAFGAFEKAAQLYTDQLGGIPEKDQSPQVFQQWFNANLGASDLSYITRQQEPSTNNLAKIRAAILALPGDAAERHMAAFAKALGESSNSLKPDLKARYLRAGLKITGEHPAAIEARKLVTYYDDLLQEIFLDVRVDGETTVGHGQPFGIYVALRHTEAVGREAGGNFNKYLQNQQNMNFWYNPYGQQPVNYRDDFEKQIREKLGEGFEILAVTFNDKKTQSRGYGRPGWREFLLAYVTLKAKDASVDKVPSLQLDLDFFDRRGQVVLPVESQVQLIDARPARVPLRPLRKLSVLQILDDRDLEAGTLSLEIKASGHGIVPELKELFDTALPGLKLDKEEDQGMVFTKIDSDGDTPSPVCERNWILKYSVAGSSGLSSFQFPKPKRDGVELAFKRYADADLVEVKNDVALAGIALQPVKWWLWGPLAAIVLVGIGGFVWRATRQTEGRAAEIFAYDLPPHITPFSVLSLLRRMEQDSKLRLGEERRRELAQTIHDLEKHFFSRRDHNGSSPELEEIAREWVSQTR
jgi:hypothetical protein